MNLNYQKKLTQRWVKGGKVLWPDNHERTIFIPKVVTEKVVDKWQEYYIKGLNKVHLNSYMGFHSKPEEGLYNVKI